MSGGTSGSLAQGSGYCGRFAPSPTGPLHFGSLVAAVASYLDARAIGGRWLVRIEDVDESRTVPGADALILRTLEQYGFEWDGEVVWQSRRTGLFREALARLQETGAVFACACSRKELGDGPYPGTCRDGLQPGREGRTWRVRVPADRVEFEDRIYGEYAEEIGERTGDFVVLRADGYFAYQLAVVVDDAAQGVTDVVRGADLLDSTPRQILLQRLLGLEPVRYAHVPVAVNSEGQKLSKQTGAAALTGAVGEELRAALAFLGQEPAPAELTQPGELWEWARRHWDVRRVVPTANPERFGGSRVP